MSLLSICQDIADKSGVDQPATVIGNSNEVAKKLLQAVKEEIDLLASEHNWRALLKPGSILMLTGTSSYSLPTDYGSMVNDTMWSRDNFRVVRFPVTPVEWNFLRGTTFVTTINKRARLKGNKIHLYEVPATAESSTKLWFEYKSSHLVQNSAGTSTRTTFTADADKLVDGLANERLIILGGTWRFKMAMGHPYQDDFGVYERFKRQVLARDHAAMHLNVRGRYSPYNVLGKLVSDQGYG